jgi:hypothetical protein
VQSIKRAIPRAVDILRNQQSNFNVGMNVARPKMSTQLSNINNFPRLLNQKINQLNSSVSNLPGVQQIQNLREPTVKTFQSGFNLVKRQPSNMSVGMNIVKNKTQNYFKPTEQFRTRDVVREIGSQAKDMTQDLVRLPYSTLMSSKTAPLLGLGGIAANKIGGNRNTFTPTSKTEKFFLGNQPITSNENSTTTNYLTKKGVNPTIAETLSGGLMLAGIAGNVTGGSKEDIAKNIAKETTEQGIKKILGKEAVNYSDDVVKALAKEKNVVKVGELLKNKTPAVSANDAMLRSERPSLNETPTPAGVSGTSVSLKPDFVNGSSFPIVSNEAKGIKPPITPKNTTQDIVAPPKGIEVPKVPSNVENAKISATAPPAGQGKGIVKATRSFPETVKQSEFVSPEVSKTVKNQLYTVRDTAELGTKAKNLVDTYPNIALEMANSPKIDDQVVAVSNELIKKYSYSTNPAEVQIAVDLTEKLAPKLTEAGRAIQAASLINRLSPEGVLVFTQRQLNKAVKINPKFEGKISNETALKLTEMTKSIQKMPDGYEKTLKTTQLYKEIQDLIPVSIGKKIATLQTMAQLLNPKTIVRNLIGNTGFAGEEAVSQTLATPIDRLVGLFTGKKTVALPNPITQGKSFIKAGATATKEAGLGVNTSNLTSQFELNQVPAFKNKMLATAEKGLNYALRVPDRAAYSAAFDDTLQGLMKTNKVAKPEEWMLEAAHQTGLYRTFQDSSNTAKLFTKIKTGLNFGKDFGLGDFVLKYPKTPANIISRGIDYSPAGYIKSLYNLAFIRNPANQREFAMSLARATTGTTSLIGLGALLGGMGIITEAPQKDTDLRNLQKKVGLGGYQLNLSALKRYFNSGFDKDSAKLQPDDALVTYDWFQPAAIGISMGAKIANNIKSGKNVTNDLTGIVTESINSGVSTLAEQPMVRGITNLVGGYGGLVENLKDTATQSLASFVPTISNQLAQLIDTDQSGHTKVRDVSSLSFVDETIKRIQTKIPFLREKLPQSVDVMGDPMTYSSKAGILSTFVTPYFLSNYTPTPEIKELFNLMDVTGEKKQFPRTVEKSVDINGKNLKLDSNQVRGYQTYVGQKTKNIMSQLLNDPRYTSLDDTGKVNRISAILTDVNAAAKIDLFGNQPKTVDAGVKAILAGSYYMGKEETAKKTKTAKIATKKTSKVKKGSSAKRTASISALKNFKTPTFTKLSTGKITLKAPRISAAELARGR